MRKCADQYCQKPFEPAQATQVYCCAACQRSAANRRWYALHREGVRSCHRKYRKRTRAAKGVYCKDWRARNKDRVARSLRPVS